MLLHVINQGQEHNRIELNEHLRKQSEMQGSPQKVILSIPPYAMESMPQSLCTPNARKEIVFPIQLPAPDHQTTLFVYPHLCGNDLTW